VKTNFRRLHVDAHGPRPVMVLVHLEGVEGRGSDEMIAICTK
jgi:hypothetical protein